MSTQLYSEVTQETPMPPGFGIIRLEDSRFYPLRVERWEEPELIGLDLIPRSLEEQVCGGTEFFSYETRIEALQWCYRLMEEVLCRGMAIWNELALASCVYPERCAWYHAVIEDITGASVYVREAGKSIRAASQAYVCSCQTHRRALVVRAPTIDEALETLANQVYADSCEQCRGDSFGLAMVQMNAVRVGDETDTCPSRNQGG